MEIPNQRVLNWGGVLACSGMMLYALYAQHFLDLAPCPLCVFQRISVILMGLVFLAAAVHNPARSGSIFYSLLLLATAAGGIGVAGRHLWLQSLPPDKVPACGPGLEFMLDSFAFTEVLQMVFSGSGECAEVDWSLFGLSMPAWVLIGLVGLLIYGLFANLVRDRL
ncbi:MAG: disulfide bond formation protein B [Gammaproteobacteria bacterium]